MSYQGYVIGGDKLIGGYASITDPDGPMIEYDTYQCQHCNAHTRREVGKGPKAMCMLCDGPTCGAKKCDWPCVPFEAKLEAWEGKRRFWKSVKLTEV